MTEEFLQYLKESKDPFEYHEFKGKYYRVGTYGLSVCKKVKGQFVQTAHSNDFRNKSLDQIRKDFKNNSTN